MARDTLVQVYSMTKPVTGTAMLQLYERGLFKLDDPVAKYVPELADVKVFAGLDAAGKPILETPRRKMTVLDLMRHTSGLTYGNSGVNICRRRDGADRSAEPRQHAGADGGQAGADPAGLSSRRALAVQPGGGRPGADRGAAVPASRSTDISRSTSSHR
ncbi:MAG: serine hydrolase domain-containing protein [Rhizomicrobium sp.]